MAPALSAISRKSGTTLLNNNLNEFIKRQGMVLGLAISRCWVKPRPSQVLNKSLKKLRETMWVLALAISGNAASNLSQIAQATFCISGSAGPLFGSPRFRCCAPQVPFLVRPGFDFDAPRFWISAIIFSPKKQNQKRYPVWGPP